MLRQVKQIATDALAASGKRADAAFHPERASTPSPLAAWAHDAEQLICDAAPMAWLYGDPSPERVEDAKVWELRAEQLLERRGTLKPSSAPREIPVTCCANCPAIGTSKNAVIKQRWCGIDGHTLVGATCALDEHCPIVAAGGRLVLAVERKGGES